jgi:hypothetical protein
MAMVEGRREYPFREPANDISSIVDIIDVDVGKGHGNHVVLDDFWIWA